MNKKAWFLRLYIVMRKGMHIGAVLLLLLLTPARHAVAQQEGFSTLGRDFWMTFMPQDQYSPGERSLRFLGAEGTSVTVVASNGWDSTMTIDPTRFVICPVPHTHGIVFHVTANTDIAVCASNYISQTYDIATVYPTPSLGWDYMVQTYDLMEYPPAYGPEFAVVAVEDSTQVTIVPPDGTERTVTLQAGRAKYFFWENTPLEGYTMDGRMSGTRVYSQPDKPIAVFQGCKCAHVLHSACDHLYEQAVPIAQWGREFVAIPTADRQDYMDVARILSASDQCHVVVNDVVVATLGAGEYLDTVLHNPLFIESSKPVSVCMYLGGGKAAEVWGPGDPASITILPTNQGLPNCVFSVVNTDRCQTHYATVLTKNCYVPGTTLDGTAVGSAFTAFDGTWSYAQLPVSPGSHTLSSSYGILNAWFYGFGMVESYGYIAGTANIYNTLYINGEEIATDAHLCVGNSVWAELHTVFGDTRWYLDGTLLENTSLRLPLLFDSAGTHTLKVMLHGDCCQQWCDSLQVTLQVHPTQRSVQEDAFCEGTSYHWRDTTILAAGTYIDSLTDAHGCDSLLVLLLDSIGKPHFDIVVETNANAFSYRLEALKLDTLTWDTLLWSATPNDPALRGHESDPIITVAPSEPTVYRLHVAEQCTTDKTVSLSPVLPPGIFVPNTFTPGQESNHYFVIVSQQPVVGKMTLYNRQGLMVYHTEDLATGWDGTANGHPCPQGAYVWHLHYHFLHDANHWYTAIGTVTLLR